MHVKHWITNNFHFYKIICVEKQVHYELYEDYNIIIFTFSSNVRVLVFDFPASTSLFIVSFYWILKWVFYNACRLLQIITCCYNMLCSGFFQTNKELVLVGSLSPISDYGGDQQMLRILIWKVVQYFNLITSLNTSNFWSHLWLYHM